LIVTLILEKKEGPGTLGPFENLTYMRSECHACFQHPIRTGALVSSACRIVAAASTYIRSSANGSNQNPAYSWQLGMTKTLVGLLADAVLRKTHLQEPIQSVSGGAILRIHGARS
jgi:hypothetical protein